MDGVVVDSSCMNSLNADALCMEEPTPTARADAASLSSSAHAPSIYDYHLAFHPSYSVPILLFRGRQPGMHVWTACCGIYCCPHLPHMFFAATLFIFQIISLTDRCTALSGGTLLEWRNMVAGLSEAYRASGSDNNTCWTFVTQQEHPTLREPWYCLHPCETAPRMQLLLHPAHGEPGQRQLMRPQLKYLLGWYSMVAPVVQLPCPLGLWMEGLT